MVFLVCNTWQEDIFLPLEVRCGFFWSYDLLCQQNVGKSYVYCFRQKHLMATVRHCRSLSSPLRQSQKQFDPLSASFFSKKCKHEPEVNFNCGAVYYNLSHPHYCTKDKEELSNTIKKSSIYIQNMVPNNQKIDMLFKQT